MVFVGGNPGYRNSILTKLLTPEVRRKVMFFFGTRETPIILSGKVNYPFFRGLINMTMTYR